MPCELSVIMPVYNEEGVVGTVITKWVETLSLLNISYELHVYNDGSTDKSLATIQNSAKKFKYVFPHDQKNRGHGPTILTGYRENSLAKWIFQIDSDDEIGPESFLKLWAVKDKFDFLCGKREGREQTLSRKLLSSISRLTISVLYGRGVSDVNVPYRLYRTCAFRDLFFKIPQNTFAPNILLTGMASRRSLRIFQTPVPFQSRKTGEVSLKSFALVKPAALSFLQTLWFRCTI
ncbi:MAG: glycosyltransferase family 2 protein [Nitrospinota bacterium]